MNTSGIFRLQALVCLFIALLLGSPEVHAAAGDLDSPDVTIGGGTVLTSVVQPDGKILLGGSFTSVAGVPRNKIARLNGDGTLDPAFNPNANDTVESIVVQGDGQILLGGYFTTLQPDAAGPVVTRRRIARLHADGTLDTTFDPNADREVLGMTVQGDGKIVIVGRFGTLQPNGAVSPSTRTKIARLLADGSLEAGFAPSVYGDVYTLALQADGKILIAGNFTGIGSTSRAGSARLNANGTVDTSYSANLFSPVNSIALQADGKILIGGDYFGMVRLNANGTQDTAFSPSPNGRVYSMAVQADGKILIAGYFTTVRSTPRNYIARLHADGTLDTAFDPNASSSTGCVALQADGKILLGGGFSSLRPNGAGVSTPRAGFARLLNDTAIQALTVPTTNQIGWMRGGSSPELTRVTFELSTDSGATWTSLGSGSRVGATSWWQIAGLALPASGQIRAQGVTGDGNGSTGGLVESVAGFSSLTALPEIAVFNGASTADADERVDHGGAIFLGAATQTFTIKNTGLADLTGLALDLSGDGAGDYVLGAPGATTLAPGATTAFTVTFAPAVLGVRNAVVNLASNDADEGAFRINVANLIPEVSVRSNGYNIVHGDSTPNTNDGTDFGSVLISGSGSTLSRTFTIRNTGAGHLTLGAIAIGGEHAADFSIDAQPVSPVVAGGSRNFTVTFDPGGLGLRRAVVSFATNDADETPFSFSLQGTGFISSNANLSDLSLSAGSLSPAFSTATTSYTASVAYGDGSIMVRPTMEDANASITVRVNGGSEIATYSGSSTIPQPLNVGLNEIEVRVTAQDGTARIYTVSVNRVEATPGNIDALDANLGLGSEGVYAMAVQPDGKTIIAGSFYTVLGVPRGNIARLHADGTLDVDFDPSVTGSIFSVVVQGDGKVLLGGSFSTLQPNGSALPVARKCIARLNADGTLDTGFDPNPDAAVRGMALQPDGKVVVGGDFSILQPDGAGVASARSRLARLNADGTLDAGFDPRPNNQVACVAVQGDGKLLVGGAFTTLQPNGGTITSRSYMARLNGDGTVDSGFNPRPGAFVASVALQADGKVLLGGDFATFQPNGATSITIRNRIARVNADGTLDAGFDPNANGRVSSLAVQADGSVLLGGSFYTLRPNATALAITRSRIARVYADGSLDFGFNPNPDGNVHAVALQADGQLLVGGAFTQFQPNGAAINIARYRFARLFNDPATQGLTATSASRIEWLRGGAAPEVGQVNFEVSTDRGASYVPLGAGTRISGGWELTGLSLPAGQIRARGRAAGGYFNGSGGMVEMVSSFGVAATPEIAVTGNSVTIANGTATPVLADHTDFGNVVLSGNGSTLTRTFTVANLGSADLMVGSVVVSGPDAADFMVSKQPAPMVAGSRGTTFAITFDPSALGLRRAIVSFNSGDADEGSFSFSLQGTGYLSSNADLSELILTPTTSGLQPAFSSATTAYAATVAHGDRSLMVSPWKVDANAIIAARVNGGAYGDVISASSSEPLGLNVGPNTVEVRVTAQDGTVKLYTVTVIRAEQATGDLHPLDAGVSGDRVYAMAVQPDGKTIVAGIFSSVMGVPRHNIARLNADGSLDTGFDPQANSGIHSVVLQPDGKVLIGGWFTTLQPNGAAAATARNRVARLNADGTLDSGFNPTANSAVYSMALQPDGKVLLGGAFTALQPNGAASAATRKYMARVNADGTLDSGFDPSPSGSVLTLAVQPDGKVLLGGSFATLQPNGAASATSRGFIARVNEDGTLDGNFDPKANNHVLSVVVQPDGKVLFGGGFTTLQPNGAASATPRKYIARLHADGSLDTAFDPSATSNVLSLAMQADGKIVVGGEFDSFWPNGAVMPTWRSCVARLNADGTVDSAFSPNANSSVYGVAVGADGRVLLGGNFTGFRPNGAFATTFRFRFARILNEPAMQSLGVLDANRISWVRGGTSPEFSQVTFELSTDGGSSYTGLGNASRLGSTANWQLTGLSLPASGHVRARGRMMSGNSSGLVESVVPFGSSSIPIETWRATYFGSAANSGNGADPFDFDQDGLVNLIEYAFGLNPTQSNPGPLPQPQRTGGNLTITFTRPAGVSGIIYGAEWSENLNDWTPVPDTGAGSQSTFSVPMAGKTSLYLRLTVTTP